MGIFSFFGNKIVTCGEGGAITLNDSHLEKRARTLRGQGVDPSRRYYFPVTGYNFRITNIACAILCGQMERVSEITRRRKEIFSLYRKLLAGAKGIGFQPIAPWAEPANWLFCITVDKEEYGKSRDELMEVLASRGIETRPFFMPIHKLPPFREGSTGRREELPVTDRLGETGLNLPTFNTLSDEDVTLISRIIQEAKG
jgi:perosamine synthetase